jgi:hypothetical protein
MSLLDNSRREKVYIKDINLSPNTINIVVDMLAIYIEHAKADAQI